MATLIQETNMLPNIIRFKRSCHFGTCHSFSIGSLGIAKIIRALHKLMWTINDVIGLASLDKASSLLGKY